MIKYLISAAILVLPAMAVAAQAAKNPTAMQFAAVLQDPGHRQMVEESAKASPAWTAYFLRRRQLRAGAGNRRVCAGAVRHKTGEPIAGEWREGLIASGCGAPITLNVLTQITAPATLATGFLLPGTTIADPVLQNYAQSFALKAAGGLPPGCKDGYVANTEFAGYESPNAGPKIGPWKEIWTLDLCGPPKRVLMHFIPDASGTTIQATLN